MALKMGIFFLLEVKPIRVKKGIKVWKKKSLILSPTISYFLLLWNQNFFLSDEYERAVATVNQLTQQIEDLKEATRDDSETVDTLKRKLETSLRDNDRMSKQNKDLGKIIDLLSSSWSNMFNRSSRRKSGMASNPLFIIQSNLTLRNC